MTQFPRPTWARPLAWLLAPVMVCLGLVAWRRFQGDPARYPDTVRGSLVTGEADIDLRVAETGRRIRRKTAALAEVVQGRRTLFEAAALFRALDQGGSSFQWARLRERFPGGSDEERHCRQVLHWLDSPYFVADPGERARLIERLKRDLEEAVRKGRVRLPEVSPEELADLRHEE
jgi:hypothetical protein